MILTVTSSLGTGNIDVVAAEQVGYFAIINQTGTYRLINPSSMSYVATPTALPTFGGGDYYINITRNGNNPINASYIYKYFFISQGGLIYSRNADYYANHILHQNTQTTLPGVYWTLFKYVHNA